jgi:hypothetical protein
MFRDLTFRHFLYPFISLVLVGPVLLMWGYWPTLGGTDIAGYEIGRDFINLWVAPQLAFGGHLSTLFDLTGFHAAVGAMFGHPLPFTTWSYPLYTLPAFWLLAQLPYFWALTVWLFGFLALLAVIVLSEIKPSQRAAALVVLLLSPGSLITIVGGQCGPFVATLTIGGILLMDRRPIVAGVLFGFLAFKPQMAVVIPFALLALGAWRAIFSAAVTVLALVALSVALFGLDAWQHYFEINGAYLVSAHREFHDSFKYMVASAFAVARMIGVSYPVGLAIQSVVTAITIATASWAVRRTNDPCERAFVLVTAAPLATPYVFAYDLVGVAAVLVWLLFGRLSWRPEWSGVCLLAWIAPPAMMLLGPLGVPVMPLALIALFVMSVRTTGQTQPAPSAAVANAPLPQPVAS